MKPIGGVQVPQGTEAPELWEPYKVWVGDLWECMGCEAQIIVGCPFEPITQDYRPDFQSTLEHSQSVVNDC